MSLPRTYVGTHVAHVHNIGIESDILSSPGTFFDIPSDGRGIWSGRVGTGSLKWVPLDAWKNAWKFWSRERHQKRNQYW